MLQPRTPDAHRRDGSTIPNAGNKEPWVAVGILTLIAFMNYVDRYLPAILAEPIKRELTLSDTMLGFINGFGFLIIYAVAGLPIARLADRGRYAPVLTVGVAIWSAMTIVAGWVQTGWQLALTRTGLAFGEAAAVPCAHAFISTNVSKHRRTFALSLVSVAAPLGKIGAFAGGGYVAALVGWRWTFVIVGAVTLLMASLPVLALPRRKAQDLGNRGAQIPRVPMSTVFRTRSAMFILAGAACEAIASYSLIGFSPSYLIRVHGMSLAEAGRSFGIVVGITSGIGVLLVGWAADRLSQKDERWIIGVPAGLSLVGIPFAVTAFVVSDARLAIACLAISSIVTSGYIAPVAAGLHRLVPSSFRGTVSAMLISSTAVLGGLGPLITGMISDGLQPAYGAQALAFGMMIVPAMFFASAICFFAATLSFLGERHSEASD